MEKDVCVFVWTRVIACTVIGRPRAQCFDFARQLLTLGDAYNRCSRIGSMGLKLKLFVSGRTGFRLTLEPS